MPKVTIDLRITAGDANAPVISRTELNVDSLDQMTLSVPKAQETIEKKAKGKKKTIPGVLTFRLPKYSGKVSFGVVAADSYSGGGLKLGSSTLTRPLILQDGEAASFFGKRELVAKNFTLSDRQITLLVGRNAGLVERTKKKS